MSGLAPRLREAETDEFPHSLACDDDTLRTDVEVDEPLDVVQVRQRIGHLQHTGQLSLLSSVEHTPHHRRRLVVVFHGSAYRVRQKIPADVEALYLA